jgi:hypothetical protein
MALILNSAGFQVFIQCESNQPSGQAGVIGKELGWNGGVIGSGVTRYIQANRIQANGGGCHCRVYGVFTQAAPFPGEGGQTVEQQTPSPLITSQDIGPHDLWYFNGGSLITDSAGLLYTDTSNRLGW